MTSTRRPISDLEYAVAAQLRATAAARKMRTTDLATATGSHRTHVSRVLNGHAHIGLDELSAICSALEVAVTDVIAAANESLTASAALVDDLDDQPRPAVKVPRRSARSRPSAS